MFLAVAVLVALTGLARCDVDLGQHVDEVLKERGIEGEANRRRRPAALTHRVSTAAALVGRR